LVPLTEVFKVSVQFADSFRKNSFPGGNPRLLAPYLRLFKRSLSASNRFLVIANLTYFFMYLFHVPTCFEGHNAHHQEIELY